MANFQDLRKRIRAAQATQKITCAMKLVEASRFRRAQERIERLRPYALKTPEVLSDVAARAGTDSQLHPLLRRHDSRRVWIVVLASNRGLAGPFNLNVCRAAEATWRDLEAAGVQVRFVAFGSRRSDASWVRCGLGLFRPVVAARRSRRSSADASRGSGRGLSLESGGCRCYTPPHGSV